MGQKRQRVGAVIAAGIFLVSSLAASIAVIWTLLHNKPQTTTATTTNSSSNTPSQTNPLVGTKMQNFTPVASVPSLQIIDTTVGTGAEATSTSTVSIDYVGALAVNGTIFDASPTGKPVSLSLSQVVPGFQQGVAGMKVGGTRRILIPAAQGYGASSPTDAIPANSDLVFDVTLHSVK